VGFQPVTTGIAGDTLIEIEQGLQENQEIITGPFRALREIKEGDKVRVKKEGGPGGEKKAAGEGREG
jgi:HlyD family secretion protein